MPRFHPYFFSPNLFSLAIHFTEQGALYIEGAKAAFLSMVSSTGLSPTLAFHTTAQTRKKWLEDMLPRFKIPDHFFPWPEEVDQSPLKPDRKALKEIAEELVRLSGME